MKNSSKLLLTTLLAMSLTPFALQADSLTVEGDLNVEASGTANGDLAVDNELTVNESTHPYSGVRAAFKVEKNGVIWAGEGMYYYETEMFPNDWGIRLMWIPEKAAFRAGEVSIDIPEAWDRSNVGMGSSAFGSTTMAKGLFSMAWGGYNRASSLCSTVWGWETLAEGDYSTAWGFRTEASGNHSTAWGEYTLASENGATVWGVQATASGSISTAWGDVTHALGTYSTAWGFNSLGYGKVSTVWGFSSAAWGVLSTAWGEQTRAEAHSSTAMGRRNIGGYTFLDDGNDNNDGDSRWFDLDPLLEVGNGTSDTSRSNALTIIKNGQTTLENKYWDEETPTAIPADPDTELDGDQSSAGEALVVKGHARFEGNVTLPRQGDILMGSFGRPEDS